MAIEPLVVSLKRLAETRAASPALQDAARVLNFRECWTGVQAGARWLREQGIRPGDRVALLGSNSAILSLAYFAVHAARAIAVPIGTDVSAAGARAVLDQCRPSLVLAEDPDQAPAYGALALPAIERLLSMGDADEVECAPDDAADLLFTTGTTGRKKGVLLTQANIASAAVNINAFVRARPDDIEVVPVPLSHSFGLGRLRCWARVGHTLVLEQGLRNPALLYKRLIEVRATGLALVPAGVVLLRRLIKDRFSDVGAHLRYLELGSAPLAPSDREWLLAMLPNTRICHHYGLTEASRSAFCELHADASKTTSIGRPSPNVDIMIADADGKPMPQRETGEILVRGEMVMQGYWEQPELTASVLRNGWLHTGDEGWIDGDGYVYLRGRRGDIINVGGLKVSPQEVESRLCEVEGIREAACVGIPDPRGILGQVVKAFIVSDRDPEEARILGALRAKLPEHELPRAFERLPALPKTESGKIKRDELRARTSPAPLTSAPASTERPDTRRSS